MDQIVPFVWQQPTQEENQCYSPKKDSEYCLLCRNVRVSSHLSCTFSPLSHFSLKVVLM